ncbi:MAG: Unknown protein [uncultured Thiotrichaceae bacterium]|uniref:DUF306 domain-containing protein n=1 Tax=uncultured Thiotrichaceae bacterium TaxID=298394 RepID=A0A6S6U380_9GAMM|nr:MAG: Unknown protein [uncultured Thiotrichaceae bacterium]
MTDSTLDLSRRRFFYTSTALLAGVMVGKSAWAEEEPEKGKEPDQITSRPAEGDCPLNSGGASLLNSEWKVESVYGNKIPDVVTMNLKVGQTTLSGEAGCNSYNAIFQQVGYTGFKITEINKGKKGCRIVNSYPSGPTVNVGDLENGYLRTLRRMGSVQQFENKLVFYNRNGDKAIEMTKVST